MVEQCRSITAAIAVISSQVTSLKSADMGAAADLWYWPWDAYRLGFHGAELPAMLIVIAFAAAALNRPIVPLWIGLAAIAWQASLFTSLNLWDYLIDPVAWLAAFIILVVVAARRCYKTKLTPV